MSGHHKTEETRRSGFNLLSTIAEHQADQAKKLAKSMGEGKLAQHLAGARHTAASFGACFANEVLDAKAAEDSNPLLTAAVNMGKGHARDTLISGLGALAGESVSGAIGGLGTAASLGGIAQPFTDPLADKAESFANHVKITRDRQFGKPILPSVVDSDAYEGSLELEATARIGAAALRLPGQLSRAKERLDKKIDQGALAFGKALVDAESLEDRFSGIPEPRPWRDVPPSKPAVRPTVKRPALDLEPVSNTLPSSAVSIQPTKGCSSVSPSILKRRRCLELTTVDSVPVLSTPPKRASPDSSISTKLALTGSLVGGLTGSLSAPVGGGASVAATGTLGTGGLSGALGVTAPLTGPVLGTAAGVAIAGAATILYDNHRYPYVRPTGLTAEEAIREARKITNEHHLALSETELTKLGESINQQQMAERELRNTQHRVMRRSSWARRLFGADVKSARQQEQEARKDYDSATVALEKFMNEH